MSELITVGGCRICHSPQELRMGVCWNCAEAESIILDGTDMDDNGPKGTDGPARTAMDKLNFILDKRGVAGRYVPRPQEKRKSFFQRFMNLVAPGRR